MTEDQTAITILLVDDEALIRKAVGNMLSRKGYWTLLAKSAAEALKVSREHRAKIQLLVTDLIMPGMDGMKLAEVLCKERPGMGVIFISAYRNCADIRVVSGSSAQSCLQKPFSQEQLFEKVKQLIEQAAPQG